MPGNGCALFHIISIHPADSTTSNCLKSDSTAANLELDYPLAQLNGQVIALISACFSSESLQAHLKGQYEPPAPRPCSTENKRR